MTFLRQIIHIGVEAVLSVTVSYSVSTVSVSPPAVRHITPHHLHPDLRTAFRRRLRFEPYPIDDTFYNARVPRALGFLQIQRHDGHLAIY